MKYFLMLLSLWFLSGAVSSASAQITARRVAREAAADRAEIRSAKLTNEGLALMKRGRVVLAKAKFEQALRLDPKNAKAHLAYADLLFKEGKSLAAYDHFTKALKFAPEGGRDRAQAAQVIARIRGQHPEWFNKAQPKPEEVSEPSPEPVELVVAGEKPMLAVFPFDYPGGDSTAQGLGAAFSEMMVTALINHGAYRIVERRQIDRVFEEQALGQTGALEAETAVAVGKILGVQTVAVGNLSRLAGGYETDARILHVESGEALLACHAKAASSAQFREAAETLAADLSIKVVKVQQAVAKDSTEAADQ